MLDHLASLTDVSGAMILWAAFLTGFLGSAHCIGMCGGLVMATASSRMENATYQLGRLLAYLFLGIIAGGFGHLFYTYLKSPWLSALPSLSLGIIFLWMGISFYNKRKVAFKFPQWLSQLSHKFIGKAFHLRIHRSLRSFLVGLFSFLLPCGFLFGAAIISASFQSISKALIVMGFFWLGTLPALSFAPEILRRVLNPLQQKSPLLVSLFFISLGITTLAVRFYHIYGHNTAGLSCH